MEPRLIRHRDAPAYLGMNKNLFAQIVRPYMVVIPIGRQGIAYDRVDLDKWADNYKRCNGRPAKINGDAKWEEKERQDSSKEAVSGTSTSSSGVVAFANLLDSIRSMQPKNTCAEGSKRSARQS